MSDTPFGLQVAQSLDGNYKGHVITCVIPAADGTAVGIGHPVKQDTTGTSDGEITVVAATAGDAIFGVVVGFKEDPSYLEQTHRTASTKRYAYVNIDPNTIYVVQEDADGGAIAAGSIGLNANLVFGGVNTTTGVCGVELDSSSVNTTAALQVKILGLAKGYDEDTAVAGTNAKYLVKINNHQLGSHTGTTGV